MPFNMKILTIFTACLALSAAQVGASTVRATSDRDAVQTLAGKLVSSGPVCGKVKYQVYIPTSSDPVVYDIELTERPVSGDSLAPCSYLIDWTLHHDGDNSKGFTAYFDGNHYRYKGNRLDEYHFKSDPTPFLIGEGRSVQDAAQFVDLLPQFMARKFAAIANDSTYCYKIENKSDDRMQISGVRRIKGFDALEYEYIFDKNTGMPVSFDIVYNPSSISEQSVSADFDWKSSEDTTGISEATLLSRYGDVFARYRTDNFSINSLVASPLPTFTSPTATHERYSHTRGEGFRAPTLLLFLDPDQGKPGEIVDRTRRAVASLPFGADVIYLFAGSDSDKAEECVPKLRAGEHLLIRARNVFRDLGVTSTPTFVFCSPDAAKVTAVQVGDSNTLGDIITQNLILASH